eukprot:TRINITY_DN3141_c0_g2_i1.p1 TRINITY_DN3141_c0_g2~~TRINITY_DN3141_c0_g2_i1.p1  ORF type:complete len:265 (+),score=99.77 TRINITY_DN3141_c0_g2_i1:80-796(+)
MFTYYPRMPGNSTALPCEKEEHQKPLMTTRHVRGEDGTHASETGDSEWYFAEAELVSVPVVPLSVIISDLVLPTVRFRRGIPRARRNNNNNDDGGNVNDHSNNNNDDHDDDDHHNHCHDHKDDDDHNHNHNHDNNHHHDDDDKHNHNHNHDNHHHHDDDGGDPIPEIDLLKIDVEGMELNVLDSIDTSQWCLIRQVAIEVHTIGHRVLQVISRLKRAGFRTTIMKQDAPGTRMVFGVR